MEKLISNGVNRQTMPKSYVLPPEKRPGKLLTRNCETIPVVDVGGADTSGQTRAEIINQISKASHEFGFFQVINHGIPKKVMGDTMRVAREFFELGVEERAKFYSEDPNQTVRLYTSIDYDNEEIHYWRDTLRHRCYPVEDYIHSWPKKPCGYREAVGAYTTETRGLALRLLELISEGLGLELSYFSDQLSRDLTFSINHYPPCPDPSLTLGLPKHSDPNLITLLLQVQGEENGLQVLKDGQWILVDPIPNALVVNIGSQLQIISNEKMKSVEHRAVTNSSAARTTVVLFLSPALECIIAPAPTLVNEHNPPLYKPFQYQEFVRTFMANKIDPESTFKPFKVQP